MRRVGAIILAAGASSRLGEPKQLALLAGEMLLARTVRIANEAGCGPLVVVLGAGASQVLRKCSVTPARTVLNKGWEKGMASSIRSGVASLVHEVDGAILMACDQPAVNADHLRRLMARHAHQRTGSAYADRRGVPAYFPADDLPRLLALLGDAGARELLAGAESIELPGGELDIDTQESLALARARYDPDSRPEGQSSGSSMLAGRFPSRRIRR